MRGGGGMRRSREEGKGHGRERAGVSLHGQPAYLELPAGLVVQVELVQLGAELPGKQQSRKGEGKDGVEGEGAPVKPQHRGEIKATADILMKVGLRTKSAVLGLPRSSFASRDPFRASSSFLKLSEA